MRLDGDGMVVGMKDAAKLIGISVISACAVMVCTLFLNFYMDIILIKDEIVSEQMMVFYQAQVSTAKVVCLVSGGCLLVTSVVMLLFYIKYYIDTHKKQLGILKALGYSNIKTAKHFWVFGISILMGTAVGTSGAFILMPWFYQLQNKDRILPNVVMHFHPSVLLYFVILPTAAFSLLAVLYACHKLKMPVLALLKETGMGVPKRITRMKKQPEKNNVGKDCQERSHVSYREQSFLSELRRSTLRSKKTLAFFMIFAAFCFSAMTQMSFSMKDLSSEMMGVMMLLIGIILACVTLFLAITTVVKGNTKTIAMMRVSGYSQKECCRALLGGYRFLSYIGFALGTVYQYALLRIMVDVVFKDFEGVPAYEFDFPIMFLSLFSFILVYEVVMHQYTEKIRKISVREIMSE